MTDALPMPEWTDAPPREPRSGPPRVLLIDDDADFLETMGEALRHEGLIVRTVRTPGEAVMHAVHDGPDVILLDIMLGPLDGIDVLEALRAEPETCAVPVIAVTALGRRDSGKMLPALGFDGLIAKPFDPGTLARALRAHIRPRDESH